jgi:hypothetical protein
MEITISGNNLEHLQLIQELAEELDLKIKTTTSNFDKNDIIDASEKSNSEKLYQLMEEMAASGGFESIIDPVAWQREIRNDRTLVGRD